MSTLKLPPPFRSAEPVQAKSDDRHKALRRIDTLTAAIKATNGRERFWRAVAMTAVNTDPSAAGERFQAGLGALLDGLDVENAHLAPQLSAEAAHFVLTNVHGPHIALHLTNNPALAQRLAELPPADQLVELGRVSVAVEAALLPPGEQPRTVGEIFNLATRASA